MRETWIFGYGSLVWRPAFPFLERRPARLAGYARRFWQGSTDHRGVPEAPGRVVTLTPAPDESCLGVAYHVCDTKRDEVLAALDHREQGGYVRLLAPVELLDDGAAREAQALVYFAAEGNPCWLGPAALDDIATQVLGARGPSGENVEYVLKLCEALRELGADDPHCFALEERLRAAARGTALATASSSGSSSR